MDTRLHQDILDALRNDNEFNFRENSTYFQQGRCPLCNDKSAYIAKDNPFVIRCNHETSCNDGDFYKQTTRERYNHLFTNLSKRYPTTKENPNATADGYLSDVRGFPLHKINGWYTQGYLPLDKNQFAPTVQFNLEGGYKWQRLINESDIRKHGDKAHIQYGAKTKNTCWTPPGFTVEHGDTIFIVEGIFHVIALTLIGKKAVAAISCRNLPRDLINSNKQKNITWALSYDNDESGVGNEYAKKYRKWLREIDEDFLIYNCPVGVDWDDLYRKNKLNDTTLEQCLLRGRINTAETAKEKAYYAYIWKTYDAEVIEHNNQLYAVNAQDFTKEILTSISGANENPIDENRNESELIKKDFKEAISTSEGREIFNSSVKLKHICNCNPNFVFADENKVTEELNYNFKVHFSTGAKPRMIRVPGNGLDTNSAFTRTLLSKAPGANFEGNAFDYNIFKRKWFREKILTVESIDYIGYHADTQSYIYPKFAYRHGVKVKRNLYDFYQLGNDNVKTNLKSIDIEFSDTFDGSWINDFYKAFHLNGIITLSFYLGSLFAQQIRKHFGYYPFLELTGEAGTGKSTMLRFCQKLIGRSDGKEGFNAAKASLTTLFRAFSQLSNAPLNLVESDALDQKDHKKGGFNFDSLKELFNGDGLKATSYYNNSNDFKNPPFLGSVLIAQNNSVDASEAILTRIVHLNSTREHHTKATKPLADEFQRMNVKDVCGFLTTCLSKEKVIIETIKREFTVLEKQFSDLEQIKINRIIECHTMVAALVKTLKLVFPMLDNQIINDSIDELKRRAVNRQQRVSGDHPTVAAFWEVYEELNWQPVKQYSDTSLLPTAWKETLNHDISGDYISINLQQFRRAAENEKVERIDLAELRKLLPASRTRQFIGMKTVKSKLDGKPRHVWQFHKSNRDRKQEEALNA